MSNCRCEPHASGTNRCVFCLAEASSYGGSELGSAVALISKIAKAGAAPTHGGGPAPHVLCDRWLEANGYDCEASRKLQREQRAAELDAQIERLRQEREAL